ncbi:hypothetical protein IJJ12_01490 [bacterium]|nr:hypothetical protein [bacterium]
MIQKLTLRHHYQHLSELMHDNWLYLFNQNFLLTISLLLCGGPMLLAYLAALPWWGAIGINVLALAWLTIVFTGVIKNLHALAVDRGVGKYPQLALEYFPLDLPVLLAYLLLEFLPFVLAIFATVYVTTHHGDSWEIMVVIYVCRFLISWWWGLSIARMIAHHQDFWSALIDSGLLVTRAWWRLAVITLNNTLAASLLIFIPIVGWWLAFDWWLLSSFYLEHRINLTVRWPQESSGATPKSRSSKKLAHQPVKTSQELLARKKAALAKAQKPVAPRRRTIYAAKATTTNKKAPVKKTRSHRQKSTK